MEMISKTLKNNKTVTALKLEPFVNDVQIKPILEALKHNKTLKALCIACNSTLFY